LGGWLYDYWGYDVAITVSILMAAITFALAFFMVPETRRNVAPETQASEGPRTFKPADWKSSLQTFRNTLPHSLSAFLVLLCIAFAVMFAWAFIEPKFMFYAYDDLVWSSSMLGLVMSTYGIAMTLGEFGLSRLSDRLGRKPVILLGLILFMAQFAGLAFFTNYILIAVSFVIAGLGNALFDPALSASILDIAPAEHQARILGIKSTAASLGNILGPALVVLFTSFLDARGIFLIATGIVCTSILFFLVVQIKPRWIGFGSRKLASERVVDRKSVR
jgi:DHA1 family multidrug resistance protein-like MFS transporter